MEIMGYFFGTGLASTVCSQELCIEVRGAQFEFPRRNSDEYSFKH